MNITVNIVNINKNTCPLNFHNKVQFYSVHCTLYTVHCTFRVWPLTGLFLFHATLLWGYTCIFFFQKCPPSPSGLTWTALNSICSLSLPTIPLSLGTCMDSLRQCLFLLHDPPSLSGFAWTASGTLFLLHALPLLFPKDLCGKPQTESLPSPYPSPLLLQDLCGQPLTVAVLSPIPRDLCGWSLTESTDCSFSPPPFSPRTYVDCLGQSLFLLHALGGVEVQSEGDLLQLPALLHQQLLGLLLSLQGTVQLLAHALKLINGHKVQVLAKWILQGEFKKRKINL